MMTDEMEAAKSGGVTGRRLGAATLTREDRLLPAAERDDWWEMRRRAAER